MPAAALDHGGGHWAVHAIAWPEAGFPLNGLREALRRAATGTSVPQRSRQTAFRLLVSTV